jgi:hypothetical protein
MVTGTKLLERSMGERVIKEREMAPCDSLTLPLSKTTLTSVVSILSSSYGVDIPTA